MACFNRIYSCNPQRVGDHSQITIQSADSRPCARIGRWSKWIVQFPVQVPHMLYTIYLMCRHQEMNTPIEKQLVPERAIHPFASPTGTQHIVTSVPLANAILHHYRNDGDEDGLFSVEDKSDNARLFLPLLRDIVEGDVGVNHFLFTCPARLAETYRALILDFIGPVKLPSMRERLKGIVQSAMNYLKSLRKTA